MSLLRHVWEGRKVQLGMNDPVTQKLRNPSVLESVPRSGTFLSKGSGGCKTR